MIEAIRHGIGRGVFIETVQLGERQNAFDGPRGSGDEFCFVGPQTEIACLDLPLLRRNAEDPRQCLQRRCLAGSVPADHRRDAGIWRKGLRLRAEAAEVPDSERLDLHPVPPDEFSQIGLLSAEAVFVFAISAHFCDPNTLTRMTCTLS